MIPTMLRLYIFGYTDSVHTSNNVYICAITEGSCIGPFGTSSIKINAMKLMVPPTECYKLNGSTNSVGNDKTSYQLTNVIIYFVGFSKVGFLNRNSLEFNGLSHESNTSCSTTLVLSLILRKMCHFHT
jgi:hypothetical protein